MKPAPTLRNDFFAGLAVVLPAIISIAVIVWLFGTVSSITDKLLFAVPRDWKYINGQRGDIHWYSNLGALLLGFGLVTLVGRLTRYYVGAKLVEMGENWLLGAGLSFPSRTEATLVRIYEQAEH